MSTLRPWSDEEKARQQFIAERLAARRNGTAVHMPRFSPFDAYLVVREHVVGVIEVKSRTCASTDFATTPIEVQKVEALFLAALPFGLTPDTGAWQALIVVHWAGDSMVGVVSASDVVRCPQALLTLRTPRDANDVRDLVYDVPRETFTRYPYTGA